MSKKTEATPKFKTEAEERLYWETHDSSAHVDWSKAQRVRLPNLKPSQSLIKTWLAEKAGGV